MAEKPSKDPTFQAIIENHARSCDNSRRTSRDRKLQDIQQVKPESRNTAECSYDLCLTNVNTLERESHSHDIIMAESTTMGIHGKNRRFVETSFVGNQVPLKKTFDPQSWQSYHQERWQNSKQGRVVANVLDLGRGTMRNRIKPLM